MIIKKLSLCVMLALTGYTGLAQNFKGNMAVEDVHKPNGTSQSAVANAVNVDLYTGTASVSIPIYSRSINGLDIGVSLGYVAKGIKVDQISSSVGLGWDLSAGGSITREVFGLEDEVTLPTVFNWGNNDSLQGRLVPGANFSVDTNGGNVDDKEYDLFHASFGGRSLEFAFTYENNAVVCQTFPKSNITVEVITKDLGTSGYTNARSGFGKKSGLNQTQDIVTFNIIDEHGNKFFFERGDYSFKHFEFPGAVFSVDSGTYYPTEKWNLVKIRTYDGKEVQFQYATKYVEYLNNVTETIHPKQQEYDANSVTYDPLQIKNVIWKGYKTHISKIIYTSGTTVSFDLDSSANARCDNKSDFRLKHIVIANEYDINTTGKLTYRFNQAYYNTPNNGISGEELTIPSACSSLVSGILNPRNLNLDSLKNIHLSRGTRLKLKSIDKIGNDDVTTERYYTFRYNTTPLPYRFAPQKDYYGYYNNRTNYPYVRESLLYYTYPNDTFYLSIPYHKDTCSAYSGGVDVLTPYWGQDRSYNLNYAKAGSLITVLNCAGGMDSLVYTDFSLQNPSCSYSRSRIVYWDFSINEGAIIHYPCNSIDTKLQGDSVNDGLCVGKIISKDGYSVQHTKTTEYIYENGQRFNRGGYTWFEENNQLAFTNYFVNPHKYVNGANHGFSTVTEIVKGYAGQQLSKVKHSFSNLMFKDANNNDTSCITLPPGIVTIPPDMLKYRMGLPLKVEQYDNNGNIFNTTENTYEYVSFPLTMYHVRDFRSGQISWIWQSRVIDHEALRLKKVTNTVDINSKTITSSQLFDYDDRNNLTRIKWADSKGDSFITHHYYNYKYLSEFGTNPTIQALSSMNTKGLEHQLSSETWKKLSNGDSVLLNFNMQVPYMNFTTNAPLYFIARFTSVINQPLSSGDVLPVGSYTSKIRRRNAFLLDETSGYGENLIKTTEATKFDSKANQIEVELDDKDTYVSSIWDVNQELKLAEAANAKYNEIAFCSFESAYTTSGQDYNKGNWSFDPQHITDIGTSMTGKYVMDMAGTDKVITSAPLPANKYVLSFWSRHTTDIPAVYLSHNSSLSAISCVKQNSVNTSSPTWDLYTAVFTADSGDHVEISGNPPPTIGSNQVYIDELRLHPIQSRMVSYTYLPMKGVSSTCDANNYIVYSEYDEMGRLIRTRDIRKNILKQTEIVCNNPYSTSTNYDPDYPDEEPAE